MTQPPATVLVARESAAARQVIVGWLQREGYKIVEVSTGQEALDRMSDTPIDLALLSTALPDMSGRAVCERIKQDTAHAATPVIELGADDRDRGFDHGADAFLHEPLAPAELLATVRTILRYHEGRQKAERLAVRLSVLTRLSLRLNNSRTFTALLSDAAAGAGTIFRTPAIVCAENADGAWFTACVEQPDLPPVLRAWSPGPGATPPPGAYGDVAADRIGLVPWPDGDTVRIAAVASRSDRSPVYLAVPTGAADPGSPVLTLLGQALAGAIDRMRSYAIEHHLALTLQRSLLPRRLPRVEGFDLAVRYVPASETAEIGGDFYELSQLDDRLVVAVGDVGGHSLHAATVMAELRHATRAYVAEGHSPAGTIDRLGTLMRRLIPGEIATICVMSLDPGTGAALLANAGHPAPLLIDGDRVVELQDHTPLLGLGSPGAVDTEFTLPVGATLVLYTDGLVERRGEHIDHGIARLIAAARNPSADLDAYCDRLLQEAGPAELFDDIAVVALRRNV